MASSKEYLNFILEQLSLLESVSTRSMMGEYLLYCRENISVGSVTTAFWSSPRLRRCG